MKKKILLGVLLSVIIIAVAGTYMYRHRFDKYEQSQEEQAAGIKAIGKDSRFLVAYFSWPSPDYPDLDATSGASNIVKDGKLYGNTEYVADILSKKLNDSFLEGYDFSGKTIVLFTTHGGNRFCRTVPTVRKLFPKANVVQGPAIYDREMDKAEQSLDKWLKDKGF